MLYILLTIIAVGILLASPDGKTLLGLLLKLAIFAGAGYLAFWVIVIVWGLFSDKDVRDNIFAAFGLALFAGYAVYGICLAYEKTKTKEQRAGVILNIKNKIKHQWVENKAKSILVIILISIIIFSWVVVPVIYS